MCNRSVGCQPGFAIPMPCQHTPCTRNIGDGIVLETQAIWRRPDNQKHPDQGNQREGKEGSEAGGDSNLHDKIRSMLTAYCVWIVPLVVI